MTAARPKGLSDVICDLRGRIASMEGAAAKRAGTLAFGVPEIDASLPGGGLAYGALHEFAGGGSGTVDGAAAALFVAGIAARTKGPVIWCLPMVSPRRLQLAAERTGTMALGVRRWRRQTEANDFGQPTASTTRWRVSVMPSEALPVPGVGRPQWFLELMRVKAGECAEFLVRACDDKGRIHLSSGSADGSHSSSRSLHSA